MGLNGRADGGNWGQFLVHVRFLRGTSDEGAELRRELRLDGGTPIGLDLSRARTLVENGLETLRHCFVDGGGRNTSTGHTHDVGLDHHIVRAADEQKMFDIVATQEKELSLSIEIVNVDNPQPRLPATGAVVAAAAGHHQAGARQLAQDQAEQGHQGQDDHERDYKEDCPRRFATKNR
jgi:hypothetical protein